MDDVLNGPRPAAVRGNDWRQVEVPPLASFRPRRPVSVVVPYYEAPEARRRDGGRAPSRHRRPGRDPQGMGAAPGTAHREGHGRLR